MKTDKAAVPTIQQLKQVEKESEQLQNQTAIFKWKTYMYDLEEVETMQVSIQSIVSIDISKFSKKISNKISVRKKNLQILLEKIEQYYYQMLQINELQQILDTVKQNMQIQRNIQKNAIKNWELKKNQMKLSVMQFKHLIHIV